MPISAAGQGRAGVERDRRHDQGRGDDLAAIDQRNPGIGQEQVAGRHRQARDRPLEVPPADGDQAQRPGRGAPRLASTRDRITCAGFCVERAGQGGLRGPPRRPRHCRPRAFPRAGAAAGRRRGRPGSAPPLRPRAGSPSRRRAARAPRSTGTPGPPRSGSAPAAAGGPGPGRPGTGPARAPSRGTARETRSRAATPRGRPGIIIPGAGANSRSRSRLRTLQIRLNLKKSVRHPSRVRKSQTSGPTPRSATSVPLTAPSLWTGSTSIRREGDRLAGQLAQGVHRRALLGVLLVPPPGGSVALPADLRRDLEAFRVVGALLVEQQVRGVSPNCRWATCWRLLL